VKEGYIVANPRATIDPKDRPATKFAAAPFANNLDRRNSLAIDQVIVELEAAAAAAKAKSHAEAKAHAVTQNMHDLASHSASAAKTPKAEPVIDAKDAADIQMKAAKAARAAELKTFFAAAKEKAKADILQLEQNAVRARTELESAAAAAASAAAKERLLMEAKSRAVAKRKEQENARTIVELESAILAAKAKSDLEAKAKSELKLTGEMHKIDSGRLQKLEIENESLKKLLVEAYIEIKALKTALGEKL
jgi:colicin import membrane protein